MKKVLRTHGFLSAFILLFPLGIIYLFSDFVRESELNARLGWWLLLIGLGYLVRHTKILRALWWMLLLLLAVSGGLDILYAMTFGGVFSSSTFMAMVQTDMEEAKGFIEAYASAPVILVLLFYWGVALWSAHQLIWHTEMLKRHKILAGLGILMVVVLLDQIHQRGRFFDAVPGFAGVAMDFGRQHQDFNKIVQARVQRYEQDPFQAFKVSSQPQTYVIVIGESLSRRHMSIYGYSRSTTPNLERYLSQMILFKNAISVFAQTTPSLSVNLTLAEAPHYQAAQQQVSLLEVFKRAGFKTFWISNQQPMRVPTYPMAYLADERHFISDDFHGVSTHRYDGYLLPYIEQALKDSATDKVIFVHLMGNHLQYRNRYPEAFEYFNDSSGIQAYQKVLSDRQLDFVNAYDNSVRYMDALLGKILDQMSSHPEVVGLVFWSDHGEEVFDTKDFKGHGPDGVTMPMLEVPFFFVRNHAYQQTFPIRDKLLQSHLEAPIRMDDFFHIGHCLMGLESDYWVKEKSLCSEKYQARPRIVYGKDYDRGLQ